MYEESYLFYVQKWKGKKLKSSLLLVFALNYINLHWAELFLCIKYVWKKTRNHSQHRNMNFWQSKYYIYVKSSLPLHIFHSRSLTVKKILKDVQGQEVAPRNTDLF